MTRAVLDANVVYGSLARDLILRLADRKLYQPIWTAEILAEVEHAILRNRSEVTPPQLAHLMTSLAAAFPDALAVVDERSLAKVPAPVDDGDRHVVAAAIAVGADRIVTQNLRHFPAHALEPLGIRVLSIDEFLCELTGEHRAQTTGALLEMSLEYSRPAMAVPDILQALRPLAPAFVKEVEDSGFDLAPQGRL